MGQDDEAAGEDGRSGGLDHGLLHVVRDADGAPEVVMVLVDAEARPVRLSFTAEGCVVFPGDAVRPVFTPDHLEVIAGKCVEAEDLWRKIARETAPGAGG